MMSTHTTQIRPSTAEIVSDIAKVIKTYLNHIPAYTGNFDDWLNTVNLYLEELTCHLDSRIAEYLPLRDDVWKLVVKELYGVMPFSKEYILKKYRKVKNNIPYLFYPSTNPKRLIILFTGYIDYEAYSRFSWYFDEKELWNSENAYLFLGDQSLYWYVGQQDMPTCHIYQMIILDTLKELKLSPLQAYTIGASMGGYAAILLATLCELKGAIAVHPQLCKKSAERYQKENWKRQINKCGTNFVDLEDVIYKYEYTPTIYLEVGRHPSDEAGLNNFIQAINSKNTLFILKRIASTNHETQSPSKALIEGLIHFFENV